MYTLGIMLLVLAVSPCLSDDSEAPVLTAQTSEVQEVDSSKPEEKEEPQLTAKEDHRHRKKKRRKSHKDRKKHHEDRKRRHNHKHRK